MAGTSTEVAKETLAYCTSCKMDLNSIIVAMKGDKIAKVQCFTCKKEHVYRAPKGVTEPKAKATRAPRKKKSEDGTTPENSIEAEWEKLMNAHKDAPMKSYSMKGQFTLGDKVKHTNFGDGIVGRLIYPNKIEVIFQKDMKILIHGGVPDSK